MANTFDSDANSYCGGKKKRNVRWMDNHIYKHKVTHKSIFFRLKYGLSHSRRTFSPSGVKYFPIELYHSTNHFYAPQSSPQTCIYIYKVCTNGEVASAMSSLINLKISIPNNKSLLSRWKHLEKTAQHRTQPEERCDVTAVSSHARPLESLVFLLNRVRLSDMNGVTK